MDHDSDDEWDEIERPAFVAGSPLTHCQEPKSSIARQRMIEQLQYLGELEVASVCDYTIERQGLRLTVTFVIQVVTTEPETSPAAGATANNFDSAPNSSSFWTVRKEHNDFRELASAIVAELGPDVDEMISYHLDRRHWTLNPSRFSERLTRHRIECLNNFLEAAIAVERIRESVSLRTFLADGQDSPHAESHGAAHGPTHDDDDDTPPPDGMWTVPGAPSLAWLAGEDGDITQHEITQHAAPTADESSDLASDEAAPTASDDVVAETASDERASAGATAENQAAAQAAAALPRTSKPPPAADRGWLMAVVGVLVALRVLHTFGGDVTISASRLGFLLAAAFGFGTVFGLSAGIDAARGLVALPSPVASLVALVARSPSVEPMTAQPQRASPARDQSARRVVTAKGAVSDAIASPTCVTTNSDADGAAAAAPLALGGPVSSLPSASPTATLHENCWSQPDAAFFRVRGPNYLNDRVKFASAPALFDLKGVDLFHSDPPMKHIARHPMSCAGRARSQQGSAAGRLFVLNFIMPWGNFVAYFQVPDDKDAPSTDSDAEPSGLTPEQEQQRKEQRAVARQVFDAFVSEATSDEYRDLRLKLIPRVVEGGWVVRRAVGPGTQAAKLAEQIKMSYFRADDHFEVDIEISSSSLACRILSVCKTATKSLVIDLAFVVEAVSAPELPECVLGALRIHRLDPTSAPVLPPFDDERA